MIYTHERNFIGPLVRSLSASSAGLRARLILVDNASADGAHQWAEDFAEHVILQNSRRLTYAENLNRILAESLARYVLLLNTDMYFDPREACLQRMVQFMDNHPRCGIASCRLLHHDLSEAHPARRFQTVPIILARRCGLGGLFSTAARDYLYADRSPLDSFRCDWVSGCFMMIRREAWRQIGPFDTRFRKYFEDVDYCERMHRAGWQVRYHGATFGYHFEQRSSKQLFSPDAWRHVASYGRWLMKRRQRASLEWFEKLASRATV